LSFEHGLNPGDVIDNTRLRDIFKVSSQGGMRRSLRTNTLVLVSDHVKGIYEDRIKQMPLRVLRGHDVVSKDGDLVSLQVKDLTFEQKAQIKMICEKKMQEFIVKRGLSIWDYRLLDKDPVPDSLYYRVMKESGGRCALCGATLPSPRGPHQTEIKGWQDRV